VNTSNSSVIYARTANKVLRVCYDCQERCHNCQGSGISPSSGNMRLPKTPCKACSGTGLCDSALDVEYGLIVRPEEPLPGLYHVEPVRALVKTDSTLLGIFSSSNYFDDTMRGWTRGASLPNVFAYHAEVELEGDGFRCSLFLNRRHLALSYSPIWFDSHPRSFVRLLKAPAKIVSERRVDRASGLTVPPRALTAWIVTLDLATPRDAVEALARQDLP
jgi:hypothetical protein